MRDPATPISVGCPVWTVVAMVSWEPWHRIEYRRETAKGKRELTYVENIEDTGWRSRFKGYSKEDWFAVYTRWCVEDFLARREAKPGHYVVTVYCTGNSTSGEPRLLGAIRIDWTAVPSSGE